MLEAGIVPAVGADIVSPKNIHHFKMLRNNQRLALVRLNLNIRSVKSDLLLAKIFTDQIVGFFWDDYIKSIKSI